MTGSSLKITKIEQTRNEIIDNMLINDINDSLTNRITENMVTQSKMTHRKANDECRSKGEIIHPTSSEANEQRIAKSIRKDDLISELNAKLDESQKKFLTKQTSSGLVRQLNNLIIKSNELDDQNKSLNGNYESTTRPKNNKRLEQCRSNHSKVIGRPIFDFNHNYAFHKNRFELDKYSMIRSLDLGTGSNASCEIHKTMIHQIDQAKIDYNSRLSNLNSQQKGVININPEKQAFNGRNAFHEIEKSSTCHMISQGKDANDAKKQNFIKKSKNRRLNESINKRKDRTDKELKKQLFVDEIQVKSKASRLTKSKYQLIPVKNHNQCSKGRIIDEIVINSRFQL